MARDWGYDRDGDGDDGTGRARWLITYADLITLLLVFFIVMYALSARISGQKFNQLAQSLSFSLHKTHSHMPADLNGDSPDIQKINKAAQTIAEKLMKHKDGLHNVKIATNDQGMVLSLLDKSFFDAGSAAIKASAYPVLNTIASQLKHMPNTIRVEGNTDNGRIHTARYASNWELSSARAIAVVRFLIDKEHLKADRLSATGYADTRPLMSNATPEGRQRNRRVDIVVVKEQEKAGLGAMTPVEIKQPKAVPSAAAPETVFRGPFGGGFSNPFQKP